MPSLSVPSSTKHGTCSNPNSTSDVPQCKPLYEHRLPFWRKNDIEDPEPDKDPYPWIMWYIWKVSNNKLFREIDMDQLETLWYAESECHAWFEANCKHEEP